MFEFMRANQMDIMLAFCAISTSMAFMLSITRFLPKRRKWVLINMELTATFLLFFDDFFDFGFLFSTHAIFLLRLSSWILFLFFSSSDDCIQR